MPTGALASPMPRRFLTLNQDLPAMQKRRRSVLVQAHGVLLADGAHTGAKVCAMTERRFFDDLSERINEALRNSPAQDIEKNLRVLLAGWFDRMDLVMREDFEVQKKLLEAALARVAALEARLAELERRAGGKAAR